ncbi:MAG: carbamoyltransferase HypF [Chitinivibrionales bacterium]|nr:carbamoyltransferase HypF [Chitinivibrionales bacterium]MBD3395596.1 carbamoyltransferase HypF [Chitinivibrionales bacterium]
MQCCTSREQYETPDWVHRSALSAARGEKRVRFRLVATGRVQGVGFRPTVFRHATELGLAGFVGNMPAGVIIEVEGPAEKVGAFVKMLEDAPPRQAHIDSIDITEVPVAGDVHFALAASARSGDIETGMPPDLALCEDCLRELGNPCDRRYGYPFLNCVNCGPRFTIIRALPYDRERTSMAAFEQCSDCAAEYADPANRRFDAQPNACARCGPSLSLIDAGGIAVEGDPIETAARLLAGGAIVAIKGLGGYHLCCDAIRATAIEALRERKNRPSKAVAVMFRGIEQAREHCEIGPDEERELCSAAAPVVVLRRKQGSGLAINISPDTGDIGAFLAYTPLHYLLLSKTGPLVMTSGNRADEPIVKDETALPRLLDGIADYALTHNRPVLRRCDDSVIRVVRGKRLFIRRSRGFVPNAVPLPVRGPSVVAVGAELKNTFCITRGAQAFVSQHIGDLSEHTACDFFEEAADDLARLLGVKPDIVARDQHPDYWSTRYAQARGAAAVVEIQHHHAHIASCMAEHGITDPVIGVALDGTGFGPDGTVWGGEFLVADLGSYRRRARFKHYRLPGGDEAVRHPVRMALSCLAAEFGAEVARFRDTLLGGIPEAEMSVLLTMLDKGVRSPLTSSCGRLFDAVSALLGLCSTITYEGQAAIRLQSAADPAIAGRYEFEIAGGDGIDVLTFSPALRALVKDIESNRGAAEIASKFHNTIAEAVCAVCDRIRGREGINVVALSGGVFQNDLLLARVTDGLAKRGFNAYSHHGVPPNDAGISLGQAVVALAKNG